MKSFETSGLRSKSSVRTLPRPRTTDWTKRRIPALTHRLIPRATVCSGAKASYQAMGKRHSSNDCVEKTYILSSIG